MPGGAPRPYDVAGWTLPAQMGVDVRTIDARFETPSMRRLDAASVSPGAIGGNPQARPLPHRCARKRWRSRYQPFADGGNQAEVALPRNTAPTDTSLLPARWSSRGSKTARELAEGLAKSLGCTSKACKESLDRRSCGSATARVALYKPWIENADEGWTRWLLERYEFQFTNITDADVRAGNLHRLHRRHHPADGFTGTVGVWKRSGRRAA